jgi:hypothetical protein
MGCVLSELFICHVLKGFSQDGLAPMVARVEDIVRKKLHYDSKLLFGPEATTQRELLQELDRCVTIQHVLCCSLR